jgi:NAD(P) transhydrogenase subunit beta
MKTEFVIQLVYIVSALLFVFGLKMLASPVSARKGNLLSALGMLLAVISTLFDQNILTFQWIIVGVVIGSAAGAFVAYRAAMTQMPEMVALLHGFGGLASVFVDWVAFHTESHPDSVVTVSIYLSIVIGSVTFTGSCIAWGKLSERIPGKSILFRGQRFVNVFVVLLLLVCGFLFCTGTNTYNVFLTIFIFSLVLGILLVIPIGGADMPVVISVLNSYSGLVACTTGFVIHNILLIIVGALVGANGIILSIIMCKAMNRSIANVLFGGFAAVTKKKESSKKEAKPISVEDAFLILESAKSVVVVPGYGLAVAQAQHAVRELSEFLENNGCEVKFAIHPVAGRMPGHMNVLLAEANISYDLLMEMDAINPIMNTVDACIVIGANDVVNPSAREDKSSPIFGMPIIAADAAKTIFVLKRGKGTGFSGVENPLFYNDKTRMLYGDAKMTLTGLVAEFKTSAASH